MKLIQIVPGIWRISIEWKENPGAGTSEVYVVNGNEHSVVIDVSKDVIVAPDALMAAVASTGARLDRLAVFLTHFHLDHSGNIGAFTDWGISALGGAREVATPLGQNSHEYFPNLAGVPRHKRDSNVEDYLDMVYPPSDVLDRIQFVEEGHIIDVEPWRFEVVHTPGHSLESCCLYERSRKILFTGDTILGGFVPPVNTTALDLHKLCSYFSTLERLKNFDVQVALPGHRQPIMGGEAFRKRIDVIETTYRNRLSKVEELLKGAASGLTAYGLLERYMTYRVEPERVSKYYLVSHVAMMLGYLEQLHDSGVAERTVREGVARYEHGHFRAAESPIF